MTDWFSDLNDRVSKGLLMPADAQPTLNKRLGIGLLWTVHSALDEALGDSDVTHIEDDAELRERHPVQWAAQRLAEAISLLEAASQPSPAAPVETNSPEQDRESDCKTNPELTGHSPKERGERVPPHLSAGSAGAWRVCWVSLNTSRTELFEDHDKATAKARETGGCVIPLYTAQPQTVGEPSPCAYTGYVAQGDENVLVRIWGFGRPDASVKDVRLLYSFPPPVAGEPNPRAIADAYSDWAWEKEGTPVGLMLPNESAQAGFFAGAKWACSVSRPQHSPQEK